MKWKPLPIGIEDFKELSERGYFFIDKTLFIKDLLDQKGKVNLFTRPRRFGKTLNLSMLRYFFEMGEDNTDAFAGTKIMAAGDEYLKWMGQFPVISLTLKSLKQPSYEFVFYSFKEEIAREYRRHIPILERLPFQADREKYMRFVESRARTEEYQDALKYLSDCLYTCTGRKSILLIDEYDVPLENAFFTGFYEQMIALIRSLFESALKTNDTLEFAVITGCLQISKESIFTGLNNIKILSVTADAYAGYFGFTPQEVSNLLQSYGLEENLDTVRQWYDGYRFGNTEVYNPWSVINYVQSCQTNCSTLARPYWSNTSSNSIVRTLIEQAELSVKQEIEDLIEGKTISKPIHEDITYGDIDSTQDNLWNFLFFTGYLKKIREFQEDETIYMELALPNREVRYVYKNTVLRWFEETLEHKELTPLYKSILQGDADKAAELLSENLMETISFYDYQESYYHGFLAGVLKHIDGYIVLSNRESGNGRPDILLKYPSVRGKAVIFEVKVARNYAELDAKCQEALEQIKNQKYEESLLQEGYQAGNILKYGVAFYRKECMVKPG